MTSLDSPLVVASRLFGSAASLAKPFGATLLEFQSGQSSFVRRFLALLVGVLLFVLGLAALLGVVVELVGLYAIAYLLVELLSRLLGSRGVT